MQGSNLIKSTGLKIVVGTLAVSGVVYGLYAQEAKSDAAKPAVAASAQAAAPAAQQPAPVEVIKVVTGTVFEEVSATGTVKAAESVILRSEIAGRIAKLNFKDSQSVKKGQILIELDTSLQQAEKDQSQAELNLAISNFKRNEDLAAKQFVSSRVKEEAEAQVKVAQAKLALSEARLQRALIRAPFDGVLGLRNVSVGEYIKDGTDLVTVDDLSKIRVDFKLPERYAAQAKIGMKVIVEPDAALKIKGLGGKVDSIDSVLDTNGRALTLRVRMGNPKGALKPGMFVKAKLILSERDGAVLVPDEAVQTLGRESIVYKVADGKAQRTSIKTGVRQNSKIEVTEGLVAGDSVIYVGLQRINRDGQPVKVVEPRAPAGKGKDGGKPGGEKPSAEKQKGEKPDQAAKPAGKKPE